MSSTLAAGPGHRNHREHRWRDHATTIASAAATLAVILACTTIARGTRGDLVDRQHGPPEDRRLELTVLGRQAVEALPLAYQADDAVIVPAATDPSIAWNDEVSVDRIVGHPVPLGARGLISYGQLTSSTDEPEWTAALTRDDRVFTDVGPLWFACTRWPGEDECEASLLVYHEAEYHFFRSGLGSAEFLEEGQPMEVFTFDSVDGGGLQQLVVGGLDGTETEQVLLTLMDGSEVSAWTDTTLGMPGETLWWTTVSRSVETVTAYGADGEVIARVAPR